MSRARSISSSRAALALCVLVPQVDDAARGPDRETREHHPLDHQVGKVLEDHPVLERAGLALVGVAHDVLRSGGFAAHQLPLETGGEAGSAHAPQSALLEVRDQAHGGLVWIVLREGHADALVGTFPVPVRIRLPRPVWPELAFRSALSDHFDQSVHVRGSHGHTVDSNPGGPLAASRGRKLLRPPRPTDRPGLSFNRSASPSAPARWQLMSRHTDTPIGAGGVVRK